LNISAALNLPATTPENYCTANLGKLFNIAHASCPCAGTKEKEKAKRVEATPHRLAKGRGQGALASLM
jgi:hypothetical protein